MTVLATRTDTGEIQSYVTNFERFVTDECRRRRAIHLGLNLDEIYDTLLEEWGGTWHVDGYIFGDEKQATLFLLRWA